MIDELLGIDVGVAGHCREVHLWMKRNRVESLECMGLKITTKKENNEHIDNTNAPKNDSPARAS